MGTLPIEIVLRDIPIQKKVVSPKCCKKNSGSFSGVNSAEIVSAGSMTPPAVGSALHCFSRSGSAKSMRQFAAPDP
jgi:hypothetical protein